MKIYDDITIVLVSFRSKDKIKNLIENIPNKFRILIIENSQDYELKREFETNDNVDIYLKDNIGYGSAANFARKKLTSKYFLLCNPDLENIDNISITNFYNNAENLYPNFLSLGPCFNEKDINPNISYIKKKKISGACMFICSISFDKIKGFDENIFLYFEEDDLCTRANKVGLYSYQIKTIFVEHKIGTSASIINENDKIKIKELTLWHFIWSKFYFYKKHKGKFLSILYFLPIFFRIIFKIILTKLLSDELNHKKYKIRLDGLISSILGKKSSKRINY